MEAVSKMSAKKSNFETKELRHEVGRYLAKILRNDASSLDIKTDSYGHVSINDLLRVMRDKYDFITRDHIEEIVEKDPQRRFDQKQDLIRARAGHTFEVKLPINPIIPPQYLYHGTNPEAIEDILINGIKKMDKCYVHLASTLQRAFIVGQRKTKSPVILTIRAKDAHDSGIRFWKSGQISDDGQIWLSDEIPAEFVK